MEKLNRVQQHLLSFGYPKGIVKEYKQGSKFYGEEIRDGHKFRENSAPKAGR